MGLRAWDCQRLQLSISELSDVGMGGCGCGWTWMGQTHFMVGPGRGPTKMRMLCYELDRALEIKR